LFFDLSNFGLLLGGVSGFLDDFFVGDFGFLFDSGDCLGK
jgi:hypothetical protein